VVSGWKIKKRVEMESIANSYHMIEVQTCKENKFHFYYESPKS
jgi:hypothetical protein